MGNTEYGLFQSLANRLPPMWIELVSGRKLMLIN